MSSNLNGPVAVSATAKLLPENMWIRMSELVATHKPVNLALGYTDMDEVVPQLLKDSLVATQASGAPVNINQYPRSQGHPALTRELAEIYSEIMGRQVDEKQEVLVTIGADESIHCIVSGTVDPGEEVIILEPFYSIYSEAVMSAGGIPKFVSLKLKEGGTSSSDFHFDEDELSRAFSDKTKAIIVNTPHNPTGKVFNKSELTFIADLCKKYNCLYISDEVYERMYYDGDAVFRVASLPDMWERTVTIGSAGKSFSVTGWKVGWTIGPQYLVSAAQKIHASSVFCVAGPMQIALAAMIKDEKNKAGKKGSYWLWLVELLRKKRDRMYKLLYDAGLNPVLPQGGYFILANISRLNIQMETKSEVKELDQKFVEWMILEKGIAAIPVSSFYSQGNKCDKYIRFCFIKEEKTLDAAEVKIKLFK